MSKSQTATSQGRTLRKVAAASFIGSTLEWYDFWLFSASAALVFGPVFFPDTSPTSGLLLSFATLGVGFVARPIGSIVFGHLGDKIGRTPILVATLVLMGVASTLMGVLPGYGTIGLWAPILLVILRLLQGFGAGAELAGVSIFAAEFAPVGKRGMWSSLGYSGSYFGTVLGTGVFAVVQLMPHDQFMSWGWRIPFLLSVVLVGVGLFIRLRLDETPVFKEATGTIKVVTAEEAAAKPVEPDVERVPLFAVIRNQWPLMLAVAGIVAGPLAATYVYQSFSLSYIANDLKMDPQIGTRALTLATFVATILTPVVGKISDRLGRRPVLIAGALFTAAFAFPFFMLVESRSAVSVYIALFVAIGIGVPIMLGTQGAMLTELFTTKNRFSGFSVSRETTAVVFAGFSPLIAIALVSLGGGSSWMVSIYIIIAALLTLIAAIAVPETAFRNLNHDLETEERLQIAN
jgi:MHS family shikimate/dehydroshikimate transporter-like MFS transporter